MQRFEVGVSDATGVVGGAAVFSCDVPPTVARHVSLMSWSVDGRSLSVSTRPGKEGNAGEKGRRSDDGRRRRRRSVG
ncbi:hypothetical protein E2C01_088139 [Portunus trituberculatus]|uniref:Uncharacterized protein n=1 Tax=Portunus trituberculatus TaxID=210409 RepID=A0A5B7JL47_PORTR|nr:hypothetical protein [Portunus trituberculatus]